MNSTQTYSPLSSTAHEITPKRDWRRALLPEDATLQQAIRNLDESSMQIVLVASPEGVLIGTITDGDIRRGLLRGLDLSSSIDSIIRRNPLVVPTEMNREMVLQLMQANQIHQLPVVDQDRHLIGLHIWNELFTTPQVANMMMVIMAGGQGTRLRPLTENCPKPMLPVAGKPMLEHIIERARNDGFRNFVLAIHYLGHMIEDYFSDGSRWDVHINYLREEQPLGTAGALSLLTPRPAAPFVVTNGDLLTDIRYVELLDFHLRCNATATMAVRLHEWQHPFGVVNTNGVDIVGFEEKPITRTHINAGIYVIDPRALDSLATNERCDMPELFTRVMEQRQRAIVYPMHEPWLDVGRPLDYQQVEKELQSNE